MNSTHTNPPRKSTGPAAGFGALIAALIAGIFILAPATAEATHDTVIYKCSASYTIEYTHTDGRVPDGKVPFNYTRGRCSKFSAKAQFYMVETGNSERHFIYLDTKNKVWGRIENCPVDCQTGIEIKGNKKVCLYSWTCFDQPNLEISFLVESGRRCEIWCDTGTFPPLGNKLKGSIIRFQEVPISLKGTSCRVTCYNSSEVYVEPILNKKKYDYNTVASGEGVACVTCKTSCSMDKKLTLDFLEVTGDGVTSVRNFLLSKGYVFASSLSWATVNQYADTTPAGVPFLP